MKIPYKTLRQRWYAVPLGIVGILLAVNMLKFAGTELSIVKISTEYGTLELTENLGITLKESIIQTISMQDGYPYTVFMLSSEASVVSLAGFDPIIEPFAGLQSSHEIIVVFDNNAYTEEALFFDITVDIDGVRWDQLSIYSGTGQQIKIYQPPPQETTGRFFAFFYQNEIERNWPSVIFQFKGYKTSTSQNVFVTTYYGLTYSYFVQDTTTTTISGEDQTEEVDSPYVSPDSSVLYIITFLMVISLFRKKRKEKIINESR